MTSLCYNYDLLRAGILLVSVMVDSQPRLEALHDALDNTISSIHNPEKAQCLQPLHKYWPIYLPSQCPKSLTSSSPIVHVATILGSATDRPFFEQHLSRIVDQNSQYYEVAIRYSAFLAQLDNLCETHPDSLYSQLLGVFHNLVYDSPIVLPVLQMVLHAHFVARGMQEKKVIVCIEQYPRTEMVALKAHMVDSFVSVQAVVTKVQQVRLLSTGLHFSCFQCKHSFLQPFVDGVYSAPGKCPNNKRHCKSRTFVPCRDKMKTIFVQRIKVQEMDAEGRVPRQMDAELRESQVGKLVTGETVTLTGLIKTETNDDKDRKNQGIFTPYMQVNSCQSLQAQQLLGDSHTEAIEQMKKDPTIFYSLIRSFCPTIFGHQLVKAGLLLGIVGGSSRNISHETSFRETSHVLLLGDPGIGKSQLLKFAVQVLPHSVYVSATSMSNSGLTVTVNKENHEQTLEAGALILADNGVCAIDQFDKASDSASLLEVMEQQTISIAKAGILCQLKCRAGVLASANPTHGCYNRGKTFMENTKISNAILSRFDLIFLMIDRPDQQRDQKLTEHIMQMHARNRKKPPSHHHDPLRAKVEHSLGSCTSLSDKYTRMAEAEGQSYTLESVRQYLGHIRQCVHPTLSKEAADILKSFYMVLRDNSPSTSFQVTSRQLESLVRLAMARARIECREEVSEDDAYEVTQLMQESLFDSFEEMGHDVSVPSKKVKMGKRNGELSLPKQRHLFVSTLSEMQQQGRVGSMWEWGELLRVAKDLELNVGDFHNFIDRLNQDGVLLQKGSKKYSFQGTYV